VYREGHAERERRAGDGGRTEEIDARRQSVRHDRDDQPRDDQPRDDPRDVEGILHTGATDSDGKWLLTRGRSCLRFPFPGDDDVHPSATGRKSPSV